MPNPRMVSARSFFSRMNQYRNENWLTDAQLLKGSEEFFRSNNYYNIEYNRVFDQGKQIFSSPIVASKMKGREDIETIVAIFRSKITRYNLSFFGVLESLLYDMVDNYENTNLMLVTDSLSYIPIIKTEELSVIIENMMKDGLYVLFLNHRFAYALFDHFEKLTKPIPVQD
ncbi:MAG TPA: hypothetical protein VE244_14485 [Nitrososphaeraceae archaeon]|nr:hypothetical protein [Nitrososphaeraceae archaeon]